jgi:hypothetical protein
VIFHWFDHGKAGRFSTVLQLGNGDKSFSQRLCHHSLSFCGTANLIGGSPLRMTDDAGGDEDPIAQAANGHRFLPSQFAFE